MEKDNLISQEDIQTVLRHATFDLPSLDSKIQKLTSNIKDLELRKI